MFTIFVSIDDQQNLILFALKLCKMFGFVQTHYVEDNSVMLDRGLGNCPEGSLQQLQGLQNYPNHKCTT